MYIYTRHRYYEEFRRVVITTLSSKECLQLTGGVENGFN